MYTHTYDAIRENVIHIISSFSVNDMFSTVLAACPLAQERIVLSEAGSCH